MHGWVGPYSLTHKECLRVLFCDLHTHFFWNTLLNKRSYSALTHVFIMCWCGGAWRHTRLRTCMRVSACLRMRFVRACSRVRVCLLCAYVCPCVPLHDLARSWVSGMYGSCASAYIVRACVRACLCVFVMCTLLCVFVFVCVCACLCSVRVKRQKYKSLNISSF